MTLLPPLPSAVPSPVPFPAETGSCCSAFSGQVSGLKDRWPQAPSTALAAQETQAPGCPVLGALAGWGGPGGGGVSPASRGGGGGLSSACAPAPTYSVRSVSALDASFVCFISSVSLSSRPLQTESLLKIMCQAAENRHRSRASIPGRQPCWAPVLALRVRVRVSVSRQTLSVKVRPAVGAPGPPLPPGDSCLPFLLAARLPPSGPR